MSSASNQFGLTPGNAPFDTIAEAFELARRRLPPSIYTVVTGGGDQTLAANTNAFGSVWLRPRAAQPFLERDLRTTVLGREISLPVILSSVGATRLYHPGGEPAVARAAGRAGTIDAVAMGNGHTIEEVAEAATGPLWQQVYMSLGRPAAEEAIDRAARAGYEALVVTVDYPVITRSIDPDAIVPAPGVNLTTARRYGLEALKRPRWSYRFVRDNIGLRMSEQERKGIIPGSVGARLRQANYSRQVSPTWSDFAWIRDAWSGPIVVKGILSGDDALRALDAGAAAVIVSNHGGTGLANGVLPTLRVLPEVVKAVDGRCEVLLDSGVRRGADVVKAVALGARAVSIGRPYVMGLAAAGEHGVTQVLEILRTQINDTLAGIGCPAVRELDKSFVLADDLRAT